MTTPPPQAEDEKRYGYQPTHRRQQPEQRYPNSLTDEEWRLVVDIFASDGDRDTTPCYPRRLLVDACCYVVRSGCSWRMLPKDFPPWQNAYRTFRRWSQQGKFEQIPTDYERNGENVRGVTQCPAPPFWMPSRRGVHYKVGRVYDAGKKAKGRKRQFWSTPWG